jgi:hypothetical protein
MNYEAMHTTQQEYLANFAAVKGEKYEKFMRGAAVVLTGADVILNSMPPRSQRENEECGARPRVDRNLRARRRGGYPRLRGRRCDTRV